MKLAALPPIVPVQVRSVACHGPRRRLEALAAAGWPVAVLEERLGMPGLFRRLRHRPNVSLETAQAVNALYSELWMQIPLDTLASHRVRARAARLGWPRPLEWDDDWLDLTPEDLAEVVAWEVRWMTEDELRRCYRLRWRHGDRTPVTVGAAREWQRRKAARVRGARKAAAGAGLRLAA